MDTLNQIVEEMKFQINTAINYAQIEYDTVYCEGYRREMTRIKGMMDMLSVITHKVYRIGADGIEELVFD